jgi:hypothetical protein
MTLMSTPRRRTRPAYVRTGAQDRASPSVMGLASFGLPIGIFWDYLYIILLFDVILWLAFLGLALSRPQV